MTAGRVVAMLLAVLMLAAGVFLLLAGNGVVGASGDTSQGWATIGGLLAGLGVALGWVVVSRARQSATDRPDLDARYGRGRPRR